ncbi:centriolar protein [Chloropicon primus]|uniref:Centriolar protein n=1 Tax=Chloropicon primus TaxID=1764295 RepID=A0A5B8MDR6_9CHLO|nr:centriolar protein [Chloropicon primus]|eukprot:QDZ17490.1 centriolar protein [Chloropicon primus]
MKKGEQIFRLHKDTITSICWAAHGTQIVTASLDATAIIWNAESAEPLSALKGHSKGIYSVDWSRDGNFVATASTDCSTRLWDVGSGLELHSYAPDVRSIVWSTSFTPDGVGLLAGYADGKARLWNVEEGHMLQALEGHTSWVVACKCSPVDSNRFATASKDGSAMIWDASSSKGTCIASRAPLTCLDWSPDGNCIVTGSKDCRIRIWDTRMLGEQVNSCKLKSELRPLPYEVLSCSWSPFGQYIATTCADELVRVYDADAGLNIHKFRGHQGTVTCSQWAPNGLYLASGSSDKSAKLWDIENMQLEEDASPTAVESGGAKGGTAFSSECKADLFNRNNYACSDALGKGREGVEAMEKDCQGSGVKEDSETSSVDYIVDEDGTRVVVLDEDLDLLEDTRVSSRRSSFSFSRGEKSVDMLEDFRLLLGNSDRYGSRSFGRVTLHSFSDKSCTWLCKERGNIEMDRGVAHCTITADSSRIAATCKDKSIWILRRTGTVSYTTETRLQSLQIMPTCFAFSNSKSGQMGASGHADGKVIFWDLEEGKKEFTLEEHQASVSCVSFSPPNPGMRMMLTASFDCTCIVWDLATRRPAWRFEDHSSYIRSAVWSPCGGYIVTASSDNSAKVYSSGRGDHKGTFLGHGCTIYVACWSPCSGHLATAGRDGTIRVWPRAQPTSGLQLRGHRSEVRSLAWSPAEDLLLSGSWDGKVMFWNPKTGSLLHSAQIHAGAVKYLGFLERGQSFMSASLDSSIRFFEISSVASEEGFKKKCEGALSQSKKMKEELAMLVQCKSMSPSKASLVLQIAESVVENAHEAIEALGPSLADETAGGVGEGLDQALDGLSLALQFLRRLR